MAAPLFPANAHRYDPYRTFKFQVVIGGQAVAGPIRCPCGLHTRPTVSISAAGLICRLHIVCRFRLPTTMDPEPLIHILSHHGFDGIIIGLHHTFR